MSCSFLPSFIADLQGETDSNFARRVFLKLFDGDGSFRRDVNDHRFHGIEDAWIRYVSQGRSAYRVIYIRKGDAVFLYRAGPHSVEDNLAPPGDLSAGVASGGSWTPPAPPQPNESSGRLISSLRTPALWQIVHSRRLIPHKEIILVSPFLTQSLLLRTAKLGKLLDDWIEDGTKITLLTRPPASSEHDIFASLEDRGLQLLFNERLHSKLYIFEVDRARLRPREDHKDLVVLGSANLTQSGFYSTRETGNEELCYDLPWAERDNLESYVAYLAHASDDLMGLKINASRRKIGIR